MKLFMLLISTILFSFSAHAQSPDCSSAALAAVKGALKSTGSYEKRHLDQWNNVIPLKSSSEDFEAYDVTVSAGSVSDDYVHYQVIVRTQNGSCDLVTKVDFLGEE